MSNGTYYLYIDGNFYSAQNGYNELLFIVYTIQGVFIYSKGIVY